MANIYFKHVGKFLTATLGLTDHYDEKNNFYEVAIDSDYFKLENAQNRQIFIKRANDEEHCYELSVKKEPKHPLIFYHFGKYLLFEKDNKTHILEVYEDKVVAKKFGKMTGQSIRFVHSKEEAEHVRKEFLFLTHILSSPKKVSSPRRNISPERITSSPRKVSSPKRNVSPESSPERITSSPKRVSSPKRNVSPESPAKLNKLISNTVYFTPKTSPNSPYK